MQHAMPALCVEILLRAADGVTHFTAFGGGTSVGATIR
jgi:hypothetical protein